MPFLASFFKNHPLTDTAGYQRYWSMLPMYMRFAAVVVVGYDVTRRESLDDCRILINDYVWKLQQHCEQRCLIVAVGNKIDLPREVSREEAVAFFEKCGVPASHYFETSVKTGEGVEKFVVNTLRLWHEANKDRLDDFKPKPKPASDPSVKTDKEHGDRCIIS